MECQGSHLHCAGQWLQGCGVRVRGSTQAGIHGLGRIQTATAHHPPIAGYENSTELFQRAAILAPDVLAELPHVLFAVKHQGRDFYSSFPHSQQTQFLWGRLPTLRGPTAAHQRCLRAHTVLRPPPSCDHLPSSGPFPALPLPTAAGVDTGSSGRHCHRVRRRRRPLHGRAHPAAQRPPPAGSHAPLLAERVV